MSPSAGRLAQAAASDDEESLVAALRDGNERAFSQVVRTHGPRMYAMAMRLLADEEAARDALQEAFLSVHRSVAAFQGKSALATWLHRIVVNASLQQLRKKARRPEVSLEEEIPKFDELGFLVGPTKENPASVEELLQRSDIRELVRRSIDGLPDACRVVLVLRDLEGYDTAATAELLGVSISATKVRLHRARTALRKKLEPVLTEAGS